MRDDITAGLSWRELHWRQPLDPARATACIRQWAADGRSPHIVLEARGSKGAVTYLVGTAPAAMRPVGAALLPLLTATTPVTDTTRLAVPVAGPLKLSTRHRPLRTNDPAAIVRALVSALAVAGEDEDVVELEAALLADLTEHTAQAAKETERLMQRRQAIQRERYKWADQAMEGAVPRDIARAKQEQLAVQLAGVEEQLAAITTLEADHERAIRIAVRLLGRLWRGLPARQRRHAPSLQSGLV